MKNNIKPLLCQQYIPYITNFETQDIRLLEQGQRRSSLPSTILLLSLRNDPVQQNPTTFPTFQLTLIEWHVQFLCIVQIHTVPLKILLKTTKDSNKNCCRKKNKRLLSMEIRKIESVKYKVPTYEISFASNWPLRSQIFGVWRLFQIEARVFLFQIQ